MQKDGDKGKSLLYDGASFKKQKKLKQNERTQQ